MPLPDMRNPKSKEKCNIQHIIIAYRRPMNIGNLLSHRNIDTNSTAPPSRHTTHLTRYRGASVCVCMCVRPRPSRHITHMTRDRGPLCVCVCVCLVCVCVYVSN